MKTLRSICAITCAISFATQAQVNDTLIEELIVVGEALDAQSEGGSRLGLSVREIPATLDVIDGEMIRNRFDLSVLDVVTRSAGVTGFGNPGNGGTSVSARGFTGQDVVTKLYDGNHYFTMAGTITFPFDTWAIESVEVLKGPASVLYGQGGIGGAYNVHPKSPSEEYDLDARVSLGEEGTSFLGFGVTGALSESVTARADYSRSESDNWVNNGNSETEMIALAASWEVNDDLTISARYDAGDQSPLRYFGVPVVDGEFVGDWTALNLSVDDTRIQYKDTIARLIADWNVSDNVSFNGEVFSLDTDRYWQTVETYFYDDTSGMIERWDPLIIGHDMEQTGFRGNFVFNSSLGDMAWKTSLGFQTSSLSLNYISNFNGSHPNSVDWGADFDTVDPDNFVAGSWSDVTPSVAALDQVSDVDQQAFFAESQLQVMDQLALVAGLRYDSIDTEYERLTYDATGARDTSVDNSVNQSVDPLMSRLGFVYDANATTALYGQYSTGETHPRGGDIVRVTNSLRESDTVTTRQFEIGVKQLAMNDRLNWYLAYFDINRQNMLIDDPDNPDPTVFTTVPEQRSSGFELGGDLSVSSNLLVYANASNLDSERDTGTEFVPTPYVADTTINAGFLYSLNEQIRLGGDYRFVDERPYEDTPLPSYTVVDLSVGWVMSEQMSFTLNAKNIFDETYATADHWTGGQWLVGQPRTLSITADFDF